MFCETYLPQIFYLAWSPDHLRVIAKLQNAVVNGGQLAIAMPRASGKSSLVLAAALWSLLANYHRFVALIAATEKHAKQALSNLKLQLTRNDLLASDWPEICLPVRALEGDARRCAGQTVDGKRTSIIWKDDMITLPTTEGGRSSGATVAVAGLTGAIRGMSRSMPDGSIARPSLVIPDDPQTAESARSDSQTHTREQLITGDVLGLAGPGQKITAIMPCTVIQRNDLADRFLDQKRNPQWNGERTAAVYSFPTNAKLWEEYHVIRSDSLRADGNQAAATRFYEANQEAMDVGAAVAWVQRFNHDELSAVQHCMNLRQDLGDAFDAEYQNLPKQERTAAAALKPEAIAARVNGLDRGTAPTACNHVTIGVDVGDALLHFVAVAWDVDAGGAIVDYGVWPRQTRAYFTSREIAEGAGSTLASVSPGAGREGAVAAGIRSLLADLFARRFNREDGATLSIDRVLIDSGYLPTVVSQTIRAAGKAGLCWPSRGVGIGASARPFSEYRRQPGEQIGNEWMVPLPSGAELRTVRLDSNFWKTFCADRLSSAPGDKGALMIFGSKPSDHRLVADHFCSEYAVPVEGRGRKLSEWRERPGNHDNHFWDALVMAAVGGSMIGVGLPPLPAPPPPRPREFRILT
jgi:hypothetical protein